MQSQTRAKTISRFSTSYYNTKQGSLLEKPSYEEQKKILIISISIATALAIIIGLCAIYLGDYYRADEGAVVVFAPEDNVSVSTLYDGNVVLEPQNATVGFIFYSSGKVEAHAYQPLMAKLAREGVLCVLVEMPFNLAVFDSNAADGIQEQYPEIEDWYIGGHSLGSPMAASYLADRTDEYKGLILLGSYSTADLSETDPDVLSIYGSEDKVLNREKYNRISQTYPTALARSSLRAAVTHISVCTAHRTATALRRYQTTSRLA